MNEIFFRSFMDEINKLAMKAPLTTAALTKAVPAAANIKPAAARGVYASMRESPISTTREEKRQSPAYLRGALETRKQRQASMATLGTRNPLPGRSVPV